MKRRPLGFTLIELVVVIGIVALLMAILLPALSKVRRQANTAKCLNNQRQLLMAVLTFSHDNNDMLPNTGGYGSTKGWAYDFNLPLTYTQTDVQNGQLWKYLNNYAIYHCPQDQGPWPPKTIDNLISYVMNGAACGYSHSSNGTLSLLRFHPDDVLFWEILPYNSAANGGGASGMIGDSTNYPSEGVVIRHKHGTTLGHVDGHADVLSYEEFNALCQFGPNMIWCSPEDADGGYAGGASYHHNPIPFQED